MQSGEDMGQRLLGEVGGGRVTVKGRFKILCLNAQTLPKQREGKIYY